MKQDEKTPLVRLDKILAKAAALSRKEAKRAALTGRITVDGVVTRSPDQKIAAASCVCLDGRELTYNENIYLMLNKPEGYVCSNDDPKSPNVFELIGDEYKKDGLFTVGRLDKNTTGLLLITDNGELAHFLLSPKRHVKKKYFLSAKFPLTEDDVLAFRQGVDIGEKALTKTAVLEICEDRLSAYLTITEGKFHQIKKMLDARGNKVTSLERIAFGPLSLDTRLKSGEYRPLDENEKNMLICVAEN
ncbi:MAG: 16S rRNA pseudouridine(516) synthase [Firmicutes bacterium HGW-Firmicutes-21]|nr:MAG: 16S rRNA pseudouridine(516) synthase [Firmicutes bacterium HGW-Firmicutes-21]